MTIKGLIQTDFIRISKDETVSKILGKLHSHGERNALIFDGRTFLGIVSKSSLLHTNLPTTQMKVANIVKRITPVTEDIDVLEAATAMFNANANILPVQKGSQIVGTIFILDLLEHLRDYDALRQLKIRDIPYEGTVCVDENEHIGAVMKIMRTHRLYDIPVLRKGELTGIISVSDIVNKYLTAYSSKKDTGGRKTSRTELHKPEKEYTEDILVKSCDSHNEQFSIEEDARLTEAADLMKKHNIMSIIINRKDKLVGMCTAQNILRTLASLRTTPESIVDISGIKKAGLETDQVSTIQRLASHEAAKLRHFLEGEFRLGLHITSHSKGGRHDKYAVTLKLDHAGKIVTSDDYDWDIETAVRKSFSNLQSRLKHVYHEA